MDLNLQDLSSVVRSWGRGVVFRGDGWIPELGNPLELEHLGDTEGDISIALNGEVAMLQVPELTGPAGHEADFTGENPVVEIPLYLTDPALLATVSPGGSKHGGRSMRTPAAEHTIVLFPEALFLKDDGNGTFNRLELSHTGGGIWTLDGIALDAAQEAMLDQSIWFWRCVFNRPPTRFRGGAGNDRKNIETVSLQVMHHGDMPQGHHLFTRGNPADYAIDIEGGS